MLPLNLPLVFKTYQDVKNNLIYWTWILLLVSIVVVYRFILNQSQQQVINDFIVSISAGLTVVVSVTLFIAYVLAICLIYGIQIHDGVYDKLLIKWRENYDVEFILARLTEPIRREALPKNFSDFARHYRSDFMKPYYAYVGDGKPGIQENTRIRFYEKITWYWVTQLNEIFISLFLICTPLYVLAYSSNSMSTADLATFILVLIALWVINRWLIRLTRKATTEATLDEIEEILSKPENVNDLKKQYKKLCTTYRL